jgi:hypothetical protein
LVDPRYLLDSNGIQPTVELGNPNCCDLGLGSCGFKVDGQPPIGTTNYTIEVGTQNGIPTEINCGTEAACASASDFVTISTSDGKTFNWTASPGVIVKAVIVKGGDPSNIYDYGAGSNGDTGLHTAINPNNQQFFDISHIDFCYDIDCAISAITAGNQTACNPQDNTYTQEVIVTYSNPPNSGTLDVNGQSFAIGTSPQTVTLIGLIADGQPVDVTAEFSADQNCTATVQALFDAPDNCRPQPPKDCVLLADGKIYIIGISPSTGNVCSNDEIVFGKGASRSELQGNVTAGDKILVKKHNTIHGTASAPQIKYSGTINNIQIGPVPPFSLPSLSFTAGGPKVKLKKGEEETLLPGSYGKVKLSQGAELTLTSGEYFFSKFKSGKYNTLIVDVSNGPVTVNIVGKVTLGKGFEVEIIGGGTTQFTINTLAKKVTIAQGSEFLGSLVAPKAKVSISKLVGIKGSICAKSIVLKNNATLLPHGSPHSLPKAFLAEDNSQEVDTESMAMPTEFVLGQNHPNPFNPSTTILFAVPKAGDITLAIYNLRGQLVRTLMSGPISAGHHRVVWNGRNQRGDRVATGVYIYQLQAKDVLLSRKLTLTK